MGDRKTAVDFYNSAVSAINDKSNPQNALTAHQLFVSAVYADPTYWQSHYQTSNNVADMNHHAAAVAGYRRALNCQMTDAERAKVCANLCDRLTRVGKAVEAEHYGLEAVRLDPRNQVGWINLSCVYQILRDTKRQVECAEKAIRLDPDNLAAQMAISFALLFDGQYVRGFDAFECRYRYALHSFTQYPYPKWRGEADATVMLVADQGMGDTLSFARFIPLALQRAKYIHVVVHRELLRCFQEAFLKYDNLNILPLGTQPAFQPADYYTTMVSLPWSLGLTQEQIVDTPQITLPSSGVASLYGQAWKVKDAKYHVGIAWGGSTLNQINPHRSIPVTTFLELCRVPGVQLYSLQVDTGHSSAAKDMHEQGAAHCIRDLAGFISDVSDTVSFLQHLDLVISIESALPHICAAIGKEAWLPYSYLGHDYRLGVSGEKMLWTPKHRVFLQQEGDSWDYVFNHGIVLALQERVDELARKAGSEAA